MAAMNRFGYEANPNAALEVVKSNDGQMWRLTAVVSFLGSGVLAAAGLTVGLCYPSSAGGASAIVILAAFGLAFAGAHSMDRMAAGG